jgi:hypothetical protein
MPPGTERAPARVSGDRRLRRPARRTEVDWDRYPARPDFVVLADPDGNRFCVVDLGKAPST